MKRILTILIVSLLSGSAFAVLEVTVESKFEGSLNGYYSGLALDSPHRQKILLLSEEGNAILVGGTAGAPYLFRTTDDFASFSDTLNLDPYFGSNHDHTHYWVRNDTVWLSWPGGPSDEQGYIGVIDCTADTFLVLDISAPTIEAGLVAASSGPYKHGGAFVPLPNSDSAGLVWRGSGNVNPASRVYDVSANWSTDLGNSVGPRTWVSDMNETTHSDGARLGVAYYDNSIIAGLFFRDSRALVKRYNRATQAWDMVGDTIWQRPMNRWYDFNVLNDTTIVFGVSNGNDEDSILYAIKRKGTASWTTGVLFDSADGSDRVGVGFSEVEYNQRMIATMLAPTGSGNHSLYFRWFAPDSLTPSDSTYTILGGDSVEVELDRFSVTHAVPSAWGDCFYIFYQSPTDNRVLKVSLADVGTCDEITLATDAQATAVTDTMITIVASHSGCGQTVDQITLLYDTDDNIAGATHIDSVTASITNPDTLVAGGLTKRTGYYFWAIVDHSLGTDTSAVYTDTTDHTTIYSATRVFTSADDDDTLVIYGTKLVADGDGWTQSSTLSNVWIDLGEDTLMFGADSGDGYWGIEFSDQTNSNIKIAGGYIIHAVDSSCDTSYGNDCSGVHLRGAGHRMDSTVVKISGGGNETGEESFGIYVNGTGTYACTLSNVNVYNYADFWYRRVDFSNACVKPKDLRGVAWNAAEDTAGYYQLVMSACSLYNYGHSGLVVYGYATADDGYARINVQNNYFYMDGQNRAWPYRGEPGWPGSSYYGRANGFCLSVTHLGGGSIISGNKIRTGSAVGGGLGMFLGSHQYGDSVYWGDTIQIYNNDIDVNFGHDNYYENYIAHGIMAQENNLCWMHFKGNTVIARADTTDATLASDSLAIAFYWNPFSGVSVGNLIEENYFAAYGPNSHPVNATQAAIDFATPDGYGDGTTVRNNVYASQGACIRYAREGVQGTYDNLSQSDTLRFLSGAQNPVSIHIGYSAGNSTELKSVRDVRLLDTYYEGATAYDDTLWSTCCEDEITYLRTCSLLVVDTLGVPVENVTCTLWNNYGDVVLDGTTNGLGIVSDTVAWQYYAFGGYAADSTSYNDMTAKAISGSDSTLMDTITVSADGQQKWTIVLAATEGGGVLDLTQTLTWADSAQTSLGVQVAFSNINGYLDSTWVLFGTSNPPTTHVDSIASPTNPDTLTFTGLTGGTAYYVRTITSDSLVYDTSAVRSLQTLTAAQEQLRARLLKGTTISGGVTIR